MGASSVDRIDLSVPTETAFTIFFLKVLEGSAEGGG